jgi:hypothetical protein
VCDPEARKLSGQGRGAVAEYLQVGRERDQSLSIIKSVHRCEDHETGEFSYLV